VDLSFVGATQNHIKATFVNSGIREIVFFPLLPGRSSEINFTSDIFIKFEKNAVLYLRQH